MPRRWKRRCSAIAAWLCSICVNQLSSSKMSLLVKKMALGNSPERVQRAREFIDGSVRTIGMTLLPSLLLQKLTK